MITYANSNSIVEKWSNNHAFILEVTLFQLVTSLQHPWLRVPRSQDHRGGALVRSCVWGPVNQTSSALSLSAVRVRWLARSLPATTWWAYRQSHLLVQPGICRRPRGRPHCHKNLNLALEDIQTLYQDHESLRDKLDRMGSTALWHEI